MNNDKDKFKKTGSPASFSYEFAKPFDKEENPEIKPACKHNKKK